MEVFLYKAKTIDGKTITGKHEAVDQAAVVSMLYEKGFFPIQVTKQGLLQKEIDLEIFQKVKIKDIAVFCRQFATIINAGIPVLDCLEILKQQTDNKKLRGVIEKVCEKVQKGNTLSVAMREHDVFPPLLLNMVESGEISGTLDGVMERIAIHYENEYKIHQKIKKAMTYPMIVAVIAFFVVAMLIIFVVPIFTGMFANFGMKLPTSTLMLISISNFIQKRWYLILFGIIALVAVFKYFASMDIGKQLIDSIKLNIPIFGKINKKIISIRFARTLSILLASGISLLTALEVTARVVDNKIVKKGLSEVQEEVSRGTSLAQAVENTGIFPPMIEHMLRIGEDTGFLEAVLAKTADFYDGEVDTVIEQMTTLLEPLILVIMAIVVAWVVISVIQPIFGMYQIIEF